MRIFKNRAFDKWSIEIGLTDQALIKAIEEMSSGLYEANLGGHIYKKRIAIGHKGKSGGVRTIVALKLHDKAFFVYGFAKNKLANITKKEEEALKGLAKIYFGFTEGQINKAIKEKELVEVL